MPSLGHWLRPPRHVLTLFLGVMGSLLLALGWLAWQLVFQEQALAAQRTQERLDHAAETAVATLRHGLDDVLQQLGSLSRLPPDAAPAGFAGQAATLGEDAALVSAGGRAFDAWPAGRLLYYPLPALGRESPAAAAGQFAAAEALEFQRRDLAGALRAFERLSRSASPQVRAAALLRTARVRSQLRRYDGALEAYSRLAELETTPAEELPAGLLARYGRCLVFRELGRSEDLAREAAGLVAALDAGTWRLSRAEYRFFRGEACVWRASEAGSEPAPPPGGRERLADAVAAAWEAWGGGPDPAEPVAGCRSIEADGVGVLFAWHRSAGRLAALVGGPQFIAARLVEPANAALQRYRARMAIEGANSGDSARGPRSGDDRPVLRAAADTRLPWSVRIVDTAPGAELAAAAAQGRLVLAGILALGLFVLGGSAFIVRAVNRELEVSRLQTEFVAAVSHEFRTPLTSIRQANELLLEGRVPEARRADYYRMQYRDSERLQRLVESLLDFGRMDSGAREYRFEAVDATAFLRTLAGEFSIDATAAGYTVELDLQPGEVFVSADREALGRAVWNLLDNAVKYSPSHRTVWLKTAVADGRVEIAVRDRGVGVPAGDERRIFEKFARGANAASSGARGTGLGLAMVRHIVTAHGGSVRLESMPGAGSTFTISLPRIHAGARAPAADSGAAGVQGGRDAPHPDCRG